MKLICKEMVSFVPHFPSNVKYNFYILHIDDLRIIVIYSTCFTHFRCNFFVLNKFFFCSALSFNYWFVFYSIST